MSLKDRIQEDVKQAMRARDKERLSALRMITATIKQREVDERIDLDDAQTLVVLERMLKQRRESISQYSLGGRADLVAKEQLECDIIQSYMPTPLTEAEIDALIAAAIATTGAQSVRDMGKVMAIVKEQAQGRADMAAVGARIKARLAG